MAKRAFLFLFFVGVFMATISSNSFAAEVSATKKLDNTSAGRLSVAENCSYAVPEKEIFAAKLISIRKKLRVEQEEIFRVKVFMKNEGNTPWFSSNSTCAGPKVALGTERERDHKSQLYSPDVDKKDNNWGAENRVYMDQNRVEPGEIASFTFYVEAPEKDDVLKEYFAPVVEGKTWIMDAEFGLDIIVGDIEEDYQSLRKKMLYAGESGSVLDLNLDGERKLFVDLSEQKLYVSLDEKVVKKISISSGAPATPTPTGEYEIKLKQDVRVGGKAPHYIMPKFMWFKDGGYGFHALPQLRTDGGTFWNEAREHIGIPVSHGCVRLLPEDADFVYEFSDLGTKVVIQK